MEDVEGLGLFAALSRNKTEENEFDLHLVVCIPGQIISYDRVWIVKGNPPISNQSRKEVLG